MPIRQSRSHRTSSARSGRVFKRANGFAESEMSGRGRPRKSLAELVRDGTSRARHHHRRLLQDCSLRSTTLERLAARYRACGNEFERYLAGLVTASTPARRR
jgi:hypothetical protein